MAARKIIQAGDPRLKSINRIIRDVDSLETKKLIKDLTSSMYKADLIGIASNQIGENRTVFLTHPRSTKARKLGKTDDLRVYINPHYNYVSPNQSLIYEGCGSVGEIFGPVLRPSEIEIFALNEKGEKFSLRCNGILARVIQHEMDHLNGIEFLEKVSDYSKIINKKFYRKNIRNSQLQMENSQVTKIDYFLVK